VPASNVAVTLSVFESMTVIVPALSLVTNMVSARAVVRNRIAAIAKMCRRRHPEAFSISHFSVYKNAAMSFASAGVTPRFGMALFGSIACGSWSQAIMFGGVFWIFPPMNAREAM